MIKTFLIQLAIFLIVGIVLGEILSRIFIPSINAEKHLHFNTTELDDKIGWKTIANHQFKDTINDAAGIEYTVDYQTFENGFRSENVSTNNSLKKVLFIGDSYTQAVEVSNDKTFYHVLGERLPIQVYAYGASGFSTLQQFMIFEKYVDEIKPDLVVWQFCSNDFIDNYHELELEARYKIGVRRPYLTLDGKMKYFTPLPKLIQWSKSSRLVYAIYLLQEKIKGKLYPSETSPLGSNISNKNIAESRIAKEHRKYKHYDTAYKITDLILKKVKNKLPKGTQILFFSADAYNPQMNDFSQICIDNQLPVEQAPAHQLNAAKFEREEIIFTYDNYHWNERGHEVVAEALLEKISVMIFSNDEL